MKKIVDGKLYNTETAEQICDYEYGYSGDFEHVWEILYRTKKGAYFIHGVGGPRSKYARECAPNEWAGGEDIRAISEDEAKTFTAANGGADLYVEYFGEVEEA